MLNVKCLAVLVFAGLFLLSAITGCASRGTAILENEEGRVINN